MSNYTTELDLLKAMATSDGNSDTLNTAISSSALPAGAATSANQSTEITSLSSIDTKLSTTNSSLSAIDAGIPAALGQTTLANSMPVALASDQFANSRIVTGTLINVNDSLTIDCTGLSSVGIHINSGQSSAPASGSINILGTPDGVNYESVYFFDVGPSPVGLAGSPQNELNSTNYFKGPPSLTNYVSSGVVDVTALKTLKLSVAALLPSTATATLIGKQSTNVIQAIASAVFCAQFGSWNVNPTGLVLAQASTTAGQTGPLVQTATTTAAPTYVTAKTNPLSTTVAGALRSDLNSLAGTTVATGNGTSSAGVLRVAIASDQTSNTNVWNSNTKQINGVVPLMGNGTTGTGSQRVTIASDNTAFSVNSVQSGTWTVQLGNTANTTAVLAQPPYATRADTYTGTASGTTVNSSTAPLSSYSIQVKGTGASATTWDIRLEGSLDNVNFTQILQHTNTTGDGAVLFSGATLSPALYIRSRCAGLTLGTATNVVVTILGIR